MNYQFSKYIKIMKHNEKIILIHSVSGQWIRISNTVYKIIKLGVENHLSWDELAKSLYDEEDRKYIKKIYSQLIELKLLFNGSEKIVNNMVVLFEITHRCNLQCKHCCIDADINTEYEMPFEAVKKILLDIVDKNPDKIVLTGGEPLLRKDFFRILEYLRSIFNGKILIMTNATLINSTNVSKIIRYVNEIDISIDGINEKTCSSVRGKGVFNTIMQSIDLLHKYKFENITLSMVFGDKNRNLTKEFLNMNKRLRTTPLIRGFTPVGRGKINKDLYYDGGLYDNIELNLSEEIINLEHTKKFTPCTCSAAKQKIIIDYKGNIYPCQCFRDDLYCLGNALDNHLEKLDTQKIFEKLSIYFPDRFSKCKACEVNMFCWPCPGELMEYAKENNDFDELCKTMKPILLKHIWAEEV